MTADETFALAYAEKKAWDNILNECFANKTTPTYAQIEEQWKGITREMIRSELAKHPTASVWLVPCYYSNGEKTVSGSVSMPYSDVRRRRFDRVSRWEESSL